MEGDSASEQQSWEDHAGSADGLGKSEGLDDKQLEQDLPAETTADKKVRALAACIEQRVAYIKCLRKGVFADCSGTERALWDCYAEQRGASAGKKFALFGYSQKD